MSMGFENPEQRPASDDGHSPDDERAGNTFLQMIKDKEAMQRVVTPKKNVHCRMGNMGPRDLRKSIQQIKNVYVIFCCVVLVFYCYKYLAT